MPIVVATIGLSIAARNGLRAGYSAEAHPFPSLFVDKLFNVFGVTITLADVGTLVFALLLVLGTQAFLAKTVTGRAMQAVAQNTESATVLGINVPRMIFYTFAINAVLACAAAVYLAYLPSSHGRIARDKSFSPPSARPSTTPCVLVESRRRGENLAAAYIRRPTRTRCCDLHGRDLFKPQALWARGREESEPYNKIPSRRLMSSPCARGAAAAEELGITCSPMGVFVIATMGLNLTSACRS